MKIYTRLKEKLSPAPRPSMVIDREMPLSSWHESPRGVQLSSLVLDRSVPSATGISREEFVQIPLGSEGLSSGLLVMPDRFVAAIILTHDPRTGAHSGSNRVIARMLHHMGFATLLMDAHTPTSECDESKSGSVSDSSLPAHRLICVADWLNKHPLVDGVPLGFVGAGSAAESVFTAAARREDLVRAVVGLAWKPNLSLIDASGLIAPTLLIAGGADTEMARINTRLLEMIPATEKDLELIPGATHLFDGPGTLEAAAIRSGRWFERHLVRAATSPRQQMLATAAWP